jgi:hypothetical protein
MDRAAAKWFRRKHWIAGLLCGLVPLVWIWTVYPLTWDSRTAPGRVLSADIRSFDEIVNSGTQGAFVAHFYELRLAYQFEAGHGRHAAIETIRASDLSWLKKFRNDLLTDGFTVVYSAGDPGTAFVRELVSHVKVKEAAALAMTAFLLGTRAFGQWMGVYRQDSWNIPLAQIKPRFWIWTALLVLFYGALIVF